MSLRSGARFCLSQASRSPLISLYHRGELLLVSLDIVCCALGPLTPLVPLIGTGSFHHLSSAQHSTGFPLRTARRTASASLRKRGRCLFAMPLEATTATKEQAPDTLAGALAASRVCLEAAAARLRCETYLVQVLDVPVHWVCTASGRASLAGGKQTAGRECAGSEHLCNIPNSLPPVAKWTWRCSRAPCQMAVCDAVVK